MRRNPGPGGPLVTLVGLGMLFGSGCGGDTPPGATDAELAPLVAAQGLTGTPPGAHLAADVNSPLAQLGARLFFSKSLSGDRDTACVTCHHPLLGGGDDLSLPIGVGAVEPDRLGPGRVHSAGAHGFDGGPTVPRNAPTTFNLVLWDKVFFHDGRLESLMKAKGAHGAGGIRTPEVPLDTADPRAGADLTTAQARFPVTSPEEMKAFNNDARNNQQMREYLASRLGGYGPGAGELADTAYWLGLFRTAFGSPMGTAQALITEQNVAAAIAEYERSQTFVNTPWRRYLQGDQTALSEEAKRGAVLFFKPADQGGAGCVSCHSGEFFTDEEFHNLAMPQLGRGKGDGIGGVEDRGRARETGRSEDMYAFRTPGLLNVEVTGPWGHAGSYTTLADVVRHHFDPAKALAEFEASKVTQPGVQNLNNLATLPALGAFNEARAAGRSKLPILTFTENEVSQLVEFLKGLTDPCTKDPACMAPWIPDPVVGADPNGDQLNATLPSR